MINVFESLKLSESVQDEFNDTVDIINKYDENRITKPFKNLYNELIENIFQIQDNLFEIEMLTSEIISELNKLPEFQRLTIYDLIRVKEIPYELEKLPENTDAIISYLFNPNHPLQSTHHFIT